MQRVLLPICFLIIGGVIGAISTNWLVLIEVDAGDWLAFVGGLLGVSLTVLGAVLVEERMRRTDQKAEVRLVAEALDELVAALAEIPSEDEAPGALQWDAARAGNVITRIDEAADLLEYARENSRLTTAKQVLAVNRVEVAIADADAVLEREGRWLENHGDKANVLEQFNKNIRGVADTLSPSLSDAIKVLRA